MAVITPCAELKNGLDLSCVRPVSKYNQQVVLINKSDIDTSTIIAPWTEDYPAGGCNYFVQFELLPGKTGYRFSYPIKGSGVFGTADTVTTDNGYTTFIHHINAMISNATEEEKCILDALSKGQVVGALQLQDGTVEIFGMRYGLFMDDTTIDIQAGGGVSAVVLSSREDGAEDYAPLIYKPQLGGSAEADFDALFANTGS